MNANHFITVCQSLLYHCNNLLNHYKIHIYVDYIYLLTNMQLTFNNETANERVSFLYILVFIFVNHTVLSQF